MEGNSMRTRRFATWLLALGAAVLVTAGMLAVARPSVAHAAKGTTMTALTVTGPTGKVRTFTLQQLKTKFKPYKGYAGYVKTAFISMEAPHPVKGVRLLDLLATVGYKRGGVTLHAADGYEFTYSQKLINGKGVTMYRAKPRKYPSLKMPASNPLTAILAYQDKQIGARVKDSYPWRDYLSTYDTDGSTGIGPLRFWWSYKDWVDPGYLQIGWSTMRMVDGLTVVK
jgi:hypothetical protein